MSCVLQRQLSTLTKSPQQNVKLKLHKNPSVIKSSALTSMDPKLKNLLKHLSINVLLPSAAFILLIKLLNIRDVVYIVGLLVIIVVTIRGFVSFYRRVILPAKRPLEFGKWAIVTGSTSGIGKDFADYLGQRGMSLLIISRTESKLIDQQKELQLRYPSIGIKYLAFDYGTTGVEKAKFYQTLDVVAAQMDEDGGIGLLINNVGTANETPKYLEEISDEDIELMINCNIFSTMNMTKAVLKYMKQRKNGGVVSISSGSGNNCGPLLQVYSSTKAFITQFSRSMKIENWDSGVDFYVCTPFYIVSNLYKRRHGTLIAPMPIKLIEGTMAQLGKKYLWQGHGYWFHGLLGTIGNYHWGTVSRYRTAMLDNRRRFEERQAKKQEDAAAKKFQ